ncbi:MAG: MASE1 domain-containing protein [Bdellovibrionaceae bacterium]|nr:MASE1 domain-containing protein [Bdellovibrio sp.]
MSSHRILPRAAKDLSWVFVSGLTYYLIAYLGLQLATLNAQASPVWPATGVAVCLFYLFGAPAALGIFCGGFLANLQTGLPVLPCFILSIGNTSEVLLGVWIFKFLIDFKNDYGRHGKVIFGVVAVVVATALSASTGTLALYIAGIVKNELIFKNWLTWWMGDLIGALFFIPFAYGISIQKWKLFNSSRKEYGMVIFLLVLSTVLIRWIFFDGRGAAYLFSIYIVLLLAARILNSFWIYVFTFLICICATYATYQGHGPFAENILNENMLHLQLFLLGLGLTGLVLGSLNEEGLRRRPAMILLFGWALSGLTFYAFFKSNNETDQLRFAEEARKAQQAIQVTLNDYFSLLDSGVALFQLNNYVSKQVWRNYVNQIMTNKKFVGVKAIGVVFGSKTDRVKEIIYRNRLRPSDVENLVVHPIPHLDPAEQVLNASLHFIVVFNERSDNEKIVIGLDFSSEKKRYEAALRARDSGAITATDNLHLSNDIQPRSAFHLLAPFYNLGAPIETLQQRQAAFRGFIYTPIIVDHFIAAALGHHSGEMHLTLEFKSPTGSTTPAYVSTSKAVDVKNKIINTTSMAGQEFQLTWRKSEKFKSSSNLVFSLMGFFGSLISLLIAIMLSSLQSLATTAQKIAEIKTREIVEKNKKWQLLTETAPIGIFLMDRTGCCTYVNSTFSQMIGMTSSQLLGYEWTQSVHHEDLPMVRQHWYELLNGGVFNCNYRLLNKSQLITYVWGQLVPMRDETNQVIGYLGVSQDISDSIIKNNSLIASSRMSSLGEMASGVAHEINNPLLIILGKADMLNIMLENDKFDSTKFKKYCQQISETTHRIAKIVRGLRSFARETSNEPFQVCGIASVLFETLELCRERFLSHNIELRLPQAINENLHCWGRPEQLAQVLLNLLNNAFDAAFYSEEKWVEVHVAGALGLIRIKVIDSGGGVPSHLVKKIFEPFYTTKEIGKGTGLGLSISKGIIDKHLGQLYVDHDAKHTTFVVEISEHVVNHEIRMVES